MTQTFLPRSGEDSGLLLSRPVSPELSPKPSAGAGRSGRCSQRGGGLRGPFRTFVCSFSLSTNQPRDPLTNIYRALSVPDFLLCPGEILMSRVEKTPVPTQRAFWCRGSASKPASRCCIEQLVPRRKRTGDVSGPGASWGRGRFRWGHREAFLPWSAWE